MSILGTVSSRKCMRVWDIAQTAPRSRHRGQRVVDSLENFHEANICSIPILRLCVLGSMRSLGIQYLSEPIGDMSHTAARSLVHGQHDGQTGKMLSPDRVCSQVPCQTSNPRSK